MPLLGFYQCNGIVVFLIQFVQHQFLSALTGDYSSLLIRLTAVTA